MRVEHETFEGRIWEAQGKMNAWLARNPSARVISVETLVSEQSTSMTSVYERTEFGLRVWFEGERADVVPHEAAAATNKLRWKDDQNG